MLHLSFQCSNYIKTLPRSELNYHSIHANYINYFYPPFWMHFFDSFNTGAMRSKAIQYNLQKMNRNHCKIVNYYDKLGCIGLVKYKPLTKIKNLWLKRKKSGHIICLLRKKKKKLSDLICFSLSVFLQSFFFKFIYLFIFLK